MAHGDPRDQIARLQADIEQLAKTLEGCRKPMALSKVAIAAAGFWTLAYLLGAIWSASLSNGQESPPDK